MPRRHREFTSRVRAGKRNKQGVRERVRRRRAEIQPNLWFAFLNGFAARDLQERGDLPDLSEQEILEWADAFHDRTGQWPTAQSGPIPESPGETWLAVEAALDIGLRGFPGGLTILRLLADNRGLYHRDESMYSIDQVLSWCDAWHEQTGHWPTRDSGTIPDTGGIRWISVDIALRHGRGSIPSGSSLARLLAERRGVLHLHLQPALTEKQILAWADAHHRRTGSWPKPRRAGIVGATPGDTWRKVDTALRRGARGLRGGSSLARLLAAHRGVRNKGDLPPFVLKRILAWADAHHARTAKWPNSWSGPIAEAPGETWSAVNWALTEGLRGLPGGSSLARLLVEQRGLKDVKHLPRLKVQGILAWADAYFLRTRRWPTRTSGPIDEAPGENWQAVALALYHGLRGLPGGSSLARLLARERGVRNHMELPSLSIPEILRWADAHRDRHGTWPRSSSGPIPEAPGETWIKVHNALTDGCRGLPGGSSLARLLRSKRGVRSVAYLAPFTIDRILAWADAHRARTGRWPASRSGPIPEAPGENWQMVENALRLGLRGLAGGSSLARLLAGKRRSHRMGAGR